MEKTNRKTIKLPSLPDRWGLMMLDQFRTVEEIRGKFASSDAYLAHCFLALEGLKPLRYAERWRSALSLIPFAGRFIAETGRQVADVHEGGAGEDGPFIIWTQCYRFKGLWNALAGRRFFMEDQEVLYFQKKLEFLTKPEKIYLSTNPVARKKVGMRTYRSYFTNLSDMPWFHYRLCCMHIQNYISTRQDSYLDKFLSTLYIPEGRTSRLINRITAQTHPDGFSKHFSPLEINLILIFWNSTQLYFRNSFKHLFNGKSKQKTRDFMKEEAEITVFLSKEIGTIPEKTQDIEAFYALQYLEDNAVIQEEKKKEIEKMKRMR